MDGIRVLYVDDEPGLLEIAKLFLEACGEFVVDTAESAAAALDIFSGRTYDAIISDFHMPGMDGIEFLRHIRASDNTIPFILFTGRGREEVVINAINNGADFYLQKGGDPKAQFAELSHKIRQAVRRRVAEQELRKSEERYRSIVNDQTEMITRFDADGTITFANEAFRSFFVPVLGLDQVMGKNFRTILQTGTFEALDKFLGALNPDKPIREMEREVTGRDGKIYWQRWSVRALFDPQGNPSEYQVVGRDITEKKVAEAATSRSKEYLNQIFSSVQAGIVIIDALTHEIADINPAGAAMIGLSKEQIIGNPCHKFFCPALNGQCPITDLHTCVDNTERMLITGDGHTIPIVKYVTRTNLDGREFLLETFIDNRERRRAEDAVRESEAKYRELADLLPQMVFETDQDLKITYANRHAITVSGFTGQDIERGINALSLIDPSQHMTMRENVQKSLSGIAFEPVEYTALRKDGCQIPVIIYSAPFYRNNTPAGFRAVVVDISARKKMEEGTIESEKKFRSIFENSPYPIAINSLPDNKFLEVNKAFLDISEYTREEILGKDPMETGFLPLSEALKLISRRLLTGKIENVPLAVTAKGGKRVHVLFSTMPVTINNKPALVTVTAEVTKLKRAEEELLRKNEELSAAYEQLTATDKELRQNYDELNKSELVLRASEEKFRALVELSLDGIIITDFLGKLLFANRAAGLIVDAPDYEEMIGKKNVMDFIAPESKVDVLRDFGKVALGIDAYLVNYKLITAANREVRVECIGKKIPFAGSSAMLVSMRDVTERRLAEERVRESEQKFASVFKSNPVALTLVSARDGKFVDVNDAFLRSTGYSRDDVVGRIAKDIGIFADSDEYGRFISAVRERRTVRGMELKCRAQSGEIRTCRFSAGVLMMSGSPHILSSVEDITEQKNVEEAARESEGKFRALVEHSLDGTLILDPRGTILFANPAAGQLIEEQNLDRIIGRKNVMEFIAPASQNDVLRDFAEVAKGTDGFLSRYRICTVRQGEKWVESIGKTLIFNSDPAILISLRDITERQRAEEALRESEGKFRSIVETSPDIIWEIDLQGNLRYISPTVTTIMGYKPDELAGTPITDLVPHQARSFVLLELERYIARKGPVVPLEVPALHRNGGVLELEIRPSPVAGADGALQGFRGVARDITERRRDLDALRQANKKLNMLSGITRHDIKNKLTVLNGYIALLHKTNPDPLNQNLISRIAAATGQITNLIQFTGEYESVGVHTPVWQDIRGLVENAGREAVIGPVMLKNDLPAGAEVFADPLIVKVVFNLVDNAVRHGGTITTIRFFHEERDGHQVIVCEDDGDGIPADEKERIFDLGFGKNTGFGLAISREILDITGVTIRETGKAGRGARFEIAVPKGQYRFPA